MAKLEGRRDCQRLSASTVPRIPIFSMPLAHHAEVSPSLYTSPLPRLSKSTGPALRSGLTHLATLLKWGKVRRRARWRHARHRNPG
jgi:hypothetical protein